MTAYTIGHSTRSVEQMLALLGEAGVKLLVDVRAWPSSRRYPQFEQAAMTSWLTGDGIRYVHMAALGGRRVPAPDSRNGGWREPAFRGYADYMASAEFRAALADLELAARATPSAIMCAEAVWWRCHRRLIADALVAHRWRVEHLGIGETHSVHQLPPFAVIERDGAVTYPPAQATLPSA
jgi:uncharacterized protein (DUF488 family)